MKDKTHLAFSDAEKTTLTDVIQSIAERCGHPISTSEISFPSLSKDIYTHQALFLEKGDALEAREFPLEPEGREPAKDIHDTVLRYIRQRMWRDLRTACLRTDPEPLRHDDGTWNTIWNERHVRRKPELQVGMSSAKGETKISTRFGKDRDILVEDSRITIPDMLPESAVAGHTLRSLGEIIELPHCGDEQVQREFERQYVYSIERDGDHLVLATGEIRHPLIGEDGVYPWRRMRRMVHETAVYAVSVNPVQYDRDRDIERFISENDRFFHENGMPGQYPEMRMAA